MFRARLARVSVCCSLVFSYGAMDVRAASSAPAPPQWVLAKAKVFLAVLGYRHPIRTTYISYPRRVVAVFEFDHVIACYSCIAPGFSRLPRGELVRVGWNRIHRDQDSLTFCGKGSPVPRSYCLHR
jgi:hypothetical protein